MSKQTSHWICRLEMPLDQEGWEIWATVSATDEAHEIARRLSQEQMGCVVSVQECQSSDGVLWSSGGGVKPTALYHEGDKYILADDDGNGQAVAS